MKKFLTIIACVMPGLGLASDTNGAVDHKAISQRNLAVLESQFAAFRNDTEQLAQASRAYCDNTAPREDVIDAFKASWLSWAPLDAYQFGPTETHAAALTVNFFPDKKNFVGRALRSLLKRPAEEQANPAVIAQSSAASQGLPAIERLLFENLQTCPALVGISGNLARIGLDLYKGWFAKDGWAELVQTAGPDNPVYLSDREFTRQIYTALSFSILRLKDHRIGRPLGSYQRSFPKRAEAWRAGLTNDILHAQLQGIADIVALGFAEAVPEDAQARINEAITDTQTRISRIGAPLSEAMDDPAKRVRAEGIQAKLGDLQTRLDQHVGPALAVQAGFSAGDGD